MRSRAESGGRGRPGAGIRIVLYGWSRNDFAWAILRSVIIGRLILQMDRGLKERLVGAAVLVVFGVWLIPWVLDGPEQSARTESDALELPIPADSSPLRHQTITLDNDRDPPTPAVAQSDPEIALAGNAAAQDSPREVAAISPVSAASSPSLAASLSATGEVGWYVQIGSYADEENALRQADRVSSYGFEASVSSFVSSGRSMRRVRVGPHSSREGAETIASSLSAHGFVAQVVLED